MTTPTPYRRATLTHETRMKQADLESDAALATRESGI
jgi:hypothetical protein